MFILLEIDLLLKQTMTYFKQYSNIINFRLIPV